MRGAEKPCSKETCVTHLAWLFPDLLRAPARGEKEHAVWNICKKRMKKGRFLLRLGLLFIFGLVRS